MYSLTKWCNNAFRNKNNDKSNKIETESDCKMAHKIFKKNKTTHIQSQLKHTRAAKQQKAACFYFYVILFHWQLKRRKRKTITNITKVATATILVVTTITLAFSYPLSNTLPLYVCASKLVSTFFLLMYLCVFCIRHYNQVKWWFCCPTFSYCPWPTPHSISTTIIITQQANPRLH